MSRYRNPPSYYSRLKAAFKRLVSECGGAEQAANQTRVKPSALYNYTNANSAENFAPIDIIQDLESYAGVYYVSEVLAQNNGFALLPVIPKDADNDMSVALAKIGKESSDVFSCTAAALHDGDIDTKEAAAVIKEIDEAISVLAALRGELGAIADKETSAFTSRFEETLPEGVKTGKEYFSS